MHVNYYDSDIGIKLLYNYFMVKLLVNNDDQINSRLCQQYNKTLIVLVFTFAKSLGFLDKLRINYLFMLSCKRLYKKSSRKNFNVYEYRTKVNGWLNIINDLRLKIMNS